MGRRIKFTAALLLVALVGWASGLLVGVSHSNTVRAEMFADAVELHHYDMRAGNAAAITWYDRSVEMAREAERLYQENWQLKLALDREERRRKRSS